VRCAIKTRVKNGQLQRRTPWYIRLLGSMLLSIAPTVTVLGLGFTMRAAEAAGKGSADNSALLESVTNWATVATYVLTAVLIWFLTKWEPDDNNTAS
jgi:hypothetical protein